MAFGSAYLIYLIIGIIAIAITAITTFKIIFRVLRGSKNNTFSFLVGFFVFLTIWAICSTIFPVLDEPLARSIAIIVPISAYLGFFSLYLFTEAVLMDKINIVRAIFFSCIITITSTLMVSDPTYLNLKQISDFGFYVKPVLLFTILQTVIMVGVGAVFLVMAIRIKKISRTPAQKNRVNWIILGVMVSFFGNIIVAVIRNVIDFPALLLITGSIGLAIVGWAFLKDPTLGFILPVEVHSITVINNGGLCLFSRTLESSSTLGEDLISGAVSSISMLMQEALGIKTQCKEIIFGNRTILLDLRDEIGAFIITESSSLLLRNALKQFTDSFERKFHDSLEMTDLSVFKPADNLMDRFFGFLAAIQPPKDD